MGKMDVAEIVTQRIIEKLEKGTIPWRQPWTAFGVARRWLPNKPYRGINTWLLAPGEYATAKQIKAAGGEIKKEETKKSHLVVYWHWDKYYHKGQENIPEENRTFTRRATPFYSWVYEINTQCTGLESKVKEEDLLEFNPIDEAEALLARYPNRPRLQIGGNEAYYSPVFDYINMPPKEQFHSVEDYYSVLFHESIHSTGHLSRLRREGVTDLSRFGSEMYAKEELVAEMGASIMLAMCGIGNDKQLDNSASYVEGWLHKLKDDKKFIFSAASQAQSAVDYIRSVEYEKEKEPAEEEISATKEELATV